MAERSHQHLHPLPTDLLPSPKTRLSEDEDDEDDEAPKTIDQASVPGGGESSSRRSPIPPSFRPSTSSSRRSLARRQSTQASGRSRSYRSRHGNSSSTSIDSTTLLDHRDQPHSLGRNMSSANPRRRYFCSRRPGMEEGECSDVTDDHDEDQVGKDEDDETVRLMSASRGQRQSYAPWTKPRRQSVSEASGLLGSTDGFETYGSSSRPFTSSGVSPPKSGAGAQRSSPTRASTSQHRYSHINHPSSVPSSIGSPPPRVIGRTFSLIGTGADGQLLSMPLAQRAQRRLTQSAVLPPRQSGDILIDIDSPRSPNDLSALPAAISQSPGQSTTHSSAASIHSRERRRTYKAEEDVCFPTEAPSPKAAWPDYTVLEEWAAEESKALDEGSAAVRTPEGRFLLREGHRKVNEPVMVDGRYRRAYAFPSAITYEEVFFRHLIRKSDAG